MPDAPQYLSLKLGQAAKTGERSTGHISYRVLTCSDRHDLYVTLTGNDGGGWFSGEIVPLSNIEAIFSTLADRHQPFPSKALRPAFVSQSVNNAGFLAALLRAEGLLVPAIENVQQHVLTDDWEIWKSVMLSEPGVPYDPVVKGGASSVKPEIPVAPKKNEPEPRGKRKGK